MPIEKDLKFPVAPVTEPARRLAGTLLVTCICAALGWYSAHAQSRFAVNWASDRLSIRASNAPLAEVVAEVARVTGLKVVGEDKLQGPVSVDFADLPAVDGLKALLTDVNYFVQQEPAADKERIGLILRVHSMARTTAAVPAGSSEPVLRIPALEALIAAEDEELEELKEEEAEDPDVEQENRENLHEAQQLALNGAIGTKATIASLERFLHDDNDQVRLESVKVLAQRPVAASVALLIEALGDDSIEVRRAAINALGRNNDPESLLKVGLALEKDPDPLVRQGALRILALRADPAASVHLQNSVKEQEPNLREAITQMLAEFARLARLKKQ